MKRGIGNLDCTNAKGQMFRDYSKPTTCKLGTRGPVQTMFVVRDVSLPKSQAAKQSQGRSSFVWLPGVATSGSSVPGALMSLAHGAHFGSAAFGRIGRAQLTTTIPILLARHPIKANPIHDVKCASYRELGS